MKITAQRYQLSRPQTATKPVVVLATALALACGISHVAAQDAVDPGVRWRPLTGYAEVVVPDKYIYHGYVVEDRGPIVQPYFEVFEEFYRGTALITSASGRFSFFTSLQPRQDDMPNAAAPGRWLYELQVEAGLELQFAKRFVVSVDYLRFDSPIDAYMPSNALQLSLRWDDKDLPGWIALYPHVTWQTALPFRWNADEGNGNYFEAGIAPEWAVRIGSANAITLKVPINIGVGDDRYYPGDAFGFATIGLSASMSLAFLPKDLGAWKFGVSGAYYYLGRAPADFTNDGDRHQSVFTATLSTEF